MAEILLVRHAKSLANNRDFTVFGNEDSPLGPKGIRQAEELKQTFRYYWGIDPATYGKPVLSSTYTRPQETAERAGFRLIETNEILNESVFGQDDPSPEEAKARHAAERWVPDETAERAALFIDLVRRGELGHQIFFTHGLYIAGVLLNLADEASANGADFAHKFQEKRGFIPDLATIVPIEV